MAVAVAVAVVAELVPPAEGAAAVAVAVAVAVVTGLVPYVAAGVAGRSSLPARRVHVQTGSTDHVCTYYGTYIPDRERVLAVQRKRYPAETMVASELVGAAAIGPPAARQLHSRESSPSQQQLEPRQLHVQRPVRPSEVLERHLG